uniref:Phosphate carrier protein, mitochondrial n=1 Tax=Toxocara canis TaxID=6265 RepID=A0A183U458_TOXCA
LKNISPLPCSCYLGKAGEVVFGSATYYALCRLGGILSCGIAYTAIVPLDLVKCRIQLLHFVQRSVKKACAHLQKDEHQLQLAIRYKDWANLASTKSSKYSMEQTYQWRTGLYLAAFASAEFFADIMLAPMEATKVRVQTSLGAPPTLRGCAPMTYRIEGLMGFYKGVPPLWLRQIPYTMMKFACFERTVEMLYKYVVPKPRSQCSKPEQL